MQICDEGYRVWHEPDGATDGAVVCFEGSLRLPSSGYEPIWGLLIDVLDRAPPAITLDLSRLAFLNSSGINILYRFAVELRGRGDASQLTVRSGPAAWQRKSLPNLQRFLPSVAIVPPA